MMHSRTQRLVALSMAVVAVGCARTQTTDMGVSDSASASVTTIDSTVVATTTTTDTIRRDTTMRDTTMRDTTAMRDTTSTRDTSVTQRDTMTSSASGDVSLGVGVASDAMVARLITTVDSAEVEAARLVLSKTQNAELRTYAQQLVDDHTASMAMLDSVRPKLQDSGTPTTTDSTTRDTTAAQTGVVGSQDINTALATLQADHGRKMESLRAQSGTEFDRTYISGQVDAHQNVLNLLRRFGTNVTDPTLRSHVESYTGKVSQHLEGARTLQRTIASE